jgi:hypothetical protein
MKQKHQLLILFILGFGIFMFTRRSEIVPTISIAILIAPIFILRFIRILPTGLGILLTCLGFILSMNIALWGLFDVNDRSAEVIYSLIRSSLLAVLYLIPYVIDRFIYPRFRKKGFISTLTFPTIIQTAETPFGTIGISICRDMDFHKFIRQAGRKRVDIMLSPSYDWPKSTGPSYLIRTIENGFSMVRPTYNGVSFAADYNGHVLARMDSDKSASGILYASLPTQGIHTLYTHIGDLLGWLCVLGVFVFWGMGSVVRQRSL